VKGALALAIGFVIFPGSVWMLLSANFGALKGYLIAATAFFGFVIMLSATWTLGLPGTPPLTGPKGVDPSFKQFSLDSPLATKYSAVKQFSGAAGNGWQDEPPESAAASGSQAQLRADLETAKQNILQSLITSYNKTVTKSSKELDVTNLDPKVFYTHQAGTTVAAIVISPKQPPAGSGLEKPTFAPKTFFAYRDPGAPYLPSLIILSSAIALFVVHLLLLGYVERRRPLGAVHVPAGAAATRAPSRV
jgi:hypothetical protein